MNMTMGADNTLPEQEAPRIPDRPPPIMNTYSTKQLKRP
jgi:hypothetical protein